MKDPDQIVKQAEAGEISWEQAIAELEQVVGAESGSLQPRPAFLEDRKSIDLALDLCRAMELDPAIVFGIPLSQSGAWPAVKKGEE